MREKSPSPPRDVPTFGEMADMPFKLQPFAKFESLVASYRESPSLYDAQAFQSSIYDFFEILHEHLTEEIETLRPEKLRAGLTEEDIQRVEKEK